MGLEWLRQAPREHGSWKFVWEALWQEHPGDEELRQVGPFRPSEGPPRP